MMQMTYPIILIILVFGMIGMIFLFSLFNMNKSSFRHPDKDRIYETKSKPDGKDDDPFNKFYEKWDQKK